MGRPEPGGFDRAVYALVRRVPPGRVLTYGQVAALVGAPRAARAVGQAMRRCPAGVPWHRVVNGRGGVSRRPDTGSMLTQRLLLRREGVPIVRGRVDLSRHGWTGTPGARFPPERARSGAGGAPGLPSRVTRRDDSGDPMKVTPPLLATGRRPSTRRGEVGGGGGRE